MVIAVASDGRNVSEHFGYCRGFVLYEENGEETGFIENPGHRPGLLPRLLAEHKVSVVIAGGMGERAQSLFADRGIEVIVGARGNCSEAVKDYLAGKLKSTGSVCRAHAHAADCHQE